LFYCNCKALLVASLIHVSGATSVQTFTILPF